MCRFADNHPHNTNVVVILFQCGFLQGVETAPNMLGASEAMLARKSFLTLNQLNRYLRVQDRLLRA